MEDVAVAVVFMIIMIKKKASIDDKCDWNTPELVTINGII